ncbi:MAG: saccharopine dehydrogenase NADP-binding domain-containing protein [Nitrospirota bacterium]
MRIFVLGVGATGSLLAQLLARQGHQVSCGDRDPDRAHRFLGKESPATVQQVNARNLWSVVRAARGAHLIVNACPAVFNTIVLRAALRLRAHYLDTASHLVRNPFKAEQLGFDARFRAKRRLAVIDAGAAPGLTNLLVACSADQLDSVEAVHVRLYESTRSENPVSQWSPDVAFAEATSRPPVYRQGRFRFGQRFGERELFRFPPPIGSVGVVLAAQDEVCTVPHVLDLQEMDVKIGGGDIERLRRWYRQGKLRKSRGLVAKRFPKTPPPSLVAELIGRGVLRNARFAAAVLVRGRKRGERTAIRWDVTFPTLYQIHLRGMSISPIAWATARLAALFIKHAPRELAGVYPPEALPAKIRRAVLADARSSGIRMVKRIVRLKASADEELAGERRPANQGS